jgi:hypothetical protein
MTAPVLRVSANFARAYYGAIHRDALVRGSCVDPPWMWSQCVTVPSVQREERRHGRWNIFSPLLLAEGVAASSTRLQLRLSALPHRRRA